MITLLKELLSPALVRALGLALLHSLWQGAALAAALAVALPLLRRRRPELRYGLAAGALALLVLAVVGTFGHLYATPAAAPAALAAGLSESLSPTTATLAAPAAEPAAAEPTTSRWADLARRAEPYLPLLVGAWLLGLLLMSGRLAGGLWLTSRLRRSARPVGSRGAGAAGAASEWPARLAALARRAGLRRPVRLLESARVAGPLVLGHLRPVVLLPLGAVAALPPALLEALLAHEVAHLLRRDYLLNLALAGVETVFFYHPAVWFMADCLRAERENCCDDRAAALLAGDRLRVARALAALAELTALAPAGPAPRLALAAAGGRQGSLLARVRRLALGPGAPTPGEGESLLAGALLLLSLLGLSAGVALAAGSPRAATPGRPAHAGWTSRPAWATLLSADTTRRRRGASGVAPAAPEAPAGPQAPAAPPAPAAAPVPAPAALPDQAALPPAPPLPPAEADTLRRLRRLTRADARPGTVVIRRDRKGRLTDLVVDGQRLDAATAPAGKKRRGKGDEVTIITLPAAPASPPRRLRGRAARVPQDLAFHFDYNLPNFDGEALRQQLDQAQRQLERAEEQVRGQMFRQFSFDLRSDEEGDEPAGRPGRVLRLRPDSAAPGSRRRYRIDLRRAPYVKLRPNGWPGAPSRRGASWQRLPDGSYVLEDTVESGTRSLRLSLTPARRAAEAAARRAELRARVAEARARLAAREAELQALEAEGRARAAERLRQGPGVPPPPPPAPPRPPRGGPAAPPLPPTSDRLRDALRRDGLLKADERSFQFELDERGARLNGQALTPEQTRRYRQLLSPRSQPGEKVRFNYSVNED